MIYDFRLILISELEKKQYKIRFYLTVAVDTNLIKVFCSACEQPNDIRSRMYVFTTKTSSRLIASEETPLLTP